MGEREMHLVGGDGGVEGFCSSVWPAYAWPNMYEPIKLMGMCVCERAQNGDGLINLMSGLSG